MSPEVWQRIRSDWQRSLPAVIDGRDTDIYPEDWAVEGLQPISRGEFEEWIRNGFKMDRSPATARTIIETVCRAFEITDAMLLGKGCMKWLVIPRHLVMVLLHEKGWSSQEIAHATNRTDHTTVLHALKAFPSKIQSDLVSERVARVRQQLGM